MTKPKIKIAIAGATGRMGRMLIEAILLTPHLELVGALEYINAPQVGEDAGAFLGKKTGISITADVALGISQADCLIDFTRPDGTLQHLTSALQAGVKMVIGTTGFSAEQLATIGAATKKIAIVMAPNMSIGVNATLKILAEATRLLSNGYDIEISEAHHRHKVDAPSGTALKMGEVIATTLGKTLSDIAVYAREGHTGERKPGSIGFSTMRGGDIVGDHSVFFIGEGERIEISHHSTSRQSYAQGALRAAQFLQTQTHGLFNMQDVLGI
ncbi:MAG: 4-hydroxy-tetrahydrodipicolinate reductase [Burkholderiales bacterium]|jgi:4-hydroxy-tetrahydrodipicolinate reductase|nr:4-hydroxy-tetrahydrodipicolinate reductase [Polynucleobacter sp.]MCX7244333.1 4-hydroxy-tetrahydrodipicolinate reductase [Burkholderiales bacterium]